MLAVWYAVATSSAERLQFGARQGRTFPLQDEGDWHGRQLADGMVVYRDSFTNLTEPIAARALDYSAAAQLWNISLADRMRWRANTAGQTGADPIFLEPFA